MAELEYGNERPLKEIKIPNFTKFVNFFEHFLFSTYNEQKLKYQLSIQVLLNELQQMKSTKTKRKRNRVGFKVNRRNFLVYLPTLRWIKPLKNSFKFLYFETCLKLFKF